MRTIYALSILLPTLLAPIAASAHNRAEPACDRTMGVTFCEQRSPGATTLSGCDRLFVESLLRTRRTTYDNLPQCRDHGNIRHRGLLLIGPMPASSSA